MDISSYSPTSRNQKKKVVRHGNRPKENRSSKTIRNESRTR